MSETTDKVVTGSPSIATSPVQEKKQLDALAKSTTEVSPQQQYKIVKVRKPDGTIVKVRRPITAEEAAAARSGPAKPKPIAKSATEKKSESTTTESNNFESITTKTNNFESTTVEVKSLKTSQSSTTAKPIATISTPATKVDNTEKSTVIVATTKIPAGKTSDKTSQESSKLTEPTVPSTADHALNTTVKGARLYRGLHRLHKGSSRLIGVLAPQWDIGDLKDGDEEISDDDDDDDDDEEYESDDEKNAVAHGNQGTASTNVNAASKEITTAAAANIATSKTTKKQSDNVKKVAAEKSFDNNTSDKAKPSVVIIEKELSFSDLEKCSIEKPVSPATEDKSLRRHYKDWSRYIIYAIMMLFPLLFMVIGILVACGNKMSTDEPYITGTLQALKVAISVWPIIFAGIVAQSLRAFATYRVERGVRLMTLEQLVNSNSVASSFKQPFLLRRFNWITLALLALWGLSPLATQAMQRIWSTTDLVTSTSLRFQNTTASGANYLGTTADIFNTVKTDFERVWSASLLLNAAVAGLGMDAFGNALIPSLDTSKPTDEWQDTDPTTGSFPTSYKYANVSTYVSPYLSNIGVPVAALDTVASKFYQDTSSYKLTISTAYLDVSCAALSAVDESDPILDPLHNGNGVQETLYLDMTAMGGQSLGSLTFASLITSNTTIPGLATPIELTDDDLTYTYAYTTCNFTQVFLDANITCQSSQCYTDAVRPTPDDKKPTNGYAFSGVDNWLTEMFGERPTNWTDPIPTNFELWLSDNDDDPIIPTPGMNLTTIPREMVEYKLAVMMNTWWNIGFAPQSITNFLSNSTDNTQFDVTDITIPISFGAAVQIDPDSMFVTNWGWLAALILCSTALLLAGIFSILWDARTVSPDVLGFASSVVRKSKYVQLPKVNSAASGAERARALGEVRVMMQDVKPSAEVGRIALGTAHANAQRLTPGRTYR